MSAMYLKRTLDCPPFGVFAYIALHIMRVDVTLVAATVPNIAAKMIVS